MSINEYDDEVSFIKYNVPSKTLKNVNVGDNSYILIEVSM